MISINKVFTGSAAVLFLAWMAKIQFIYGGDFLFRLGSLGIILSLAARLLSVRSKTGLVKAGLRRLYTVNLLCLILMYAGMMLKVSHLMETQFQKDLVLDFIGIPAMFTGIVYTIYCWEALSLAETSLKHDFVRSILLPMILFWLSFMLYVVYSLNLAVSGS